MEIIPTHELDALLSAMIGSAEGISDLLFVANRMPQVEVHGRLKPFAPEAPGAANWATLPPPAPAYAPPLINACCSGETVPALSSTFRKTGRTISTTTRSPMIARMIVSAAWKISARGTPISISEGPPFRSLLMSICANCMFTTSSVSPRVASKLTAERTSSLILVSSSSVRGT